MTLATMAEMEAATIAKSCLDRLAGLRADRFVAIGSPSLRSQLKFLLYFFGAFWILYKEIRNLYVADLRRERIERIVVRPRPWFILPNRWNNILPKTIKEKIGED